MSVDLENPEADYAYEDEEYFDEGDEDGEEEGEEELSNGLAPARTILLHSAWDSPPMHSIPLETDTDMMGEQEAIVPSYDEMAVRESMEESLLIAQQYCRNQAEDEDWESTVNQ